MQGVGFWCSQAFPVIRSQIKTLEKDGEHLSTAHMAVCPLFDRIELL